MALGKSEQRGRRYMTLQQELELKYPGVLRGKLRADVLGQVKRAVAALAASLIASPEGQAAFRESFAIYQEELKKEAAPLSGPPASVSGAVPRDHVL